MNRCDAPLFVALCIAALLPGPLAADVPSDPIFGAGLDIIRLDDDIVSNDRWVQGNTYIIPSLKQLFVKSGATLIVYPGTRIRAEQGATLVVARGSRIEASGTSIEPIVFTSAQPVGQRTSGYWGGVILLGAAPINSNVDSQPPSNEAFYEGVYGGVPEGKFGGNNPNDNSGTLRHVRIEFGGSLIIGDREFNNLTLGGVGAATTIDYVQLHRGHDDGVELVGGAVNLKHIVSSQNGDDGIDTTDGWRGKAQFLIVQNVVPDGALEAADGLESDNHSVAASYTTDPRTLPTVYNLTVIGNPTYSGGSSFAAVMRRGTGGHYFNTILMEFPQGIEFRDQATKDQLDAGNFFYKNSIFYNCAAATGGNWPPPQTTNDIDEQLYMANPAWNNREVDPGLPASRNSLTDPHFNLIFGANASVGGATPPGDGFFDTTATFVGAVGLDEWTTGWTSFAQN